jgi:hypothetical protein
MGGLPTTNAEGFGDGWPVGSGRPPADVSGACVSDPLNPGEAHQIMQKIQGPAPLAPTRLVAALPGPASHSESSRVGIWRGKPAAISSTLSAR